MFIEHTHLHMQVVEGHGEFLLIKLLIAGAKEQTGLCLENLSDIPWVTLELKRWESMRRGVFSVLKEKGIKDAEIGILEVRWLDVDSPEWLFEDVSKACVQWALADPETKFTESGDDRYLARYKERNREFWEEWGVSAPQG